MKPYALALCLATTLALAAPAAAEVKVGDAAPDFTLKDQDGKEVKLSSFAGQRNVLVAFYPKDFSPGCTNEMKSFARDSRKVQARDTVVLAVSADTCESHAKFAKSLGLQFRLLADTELVAAKLYDVYVPSPGGAYASRSAFLVDKQGKVRWLDRSLKVPPGTLEGTEVLAQIEKVGGTTDPVAALAELPSPEREGKTVFVRFVQALIAEDANALDALLDAEAFGKPTDTQVMQRDRRKAALDRWRALFEKNDLRSLRFEEVADLATTRVFTKEAATAAALTAYGNHVREVGGRLAEGEILVVGRTHAPKVGDAQPIPRDSGMRLKLRDGTWKVMEVQ